MSSCIIRKGTYECFWKNIYRIFNCGIYSDSEWLAGFQIVSWESKSKHMPM